MPATLKFLTRDSVDEIVDMSDSAMGFFGPAGFGSSIPVGNWNSRTFLTNGNGTVEGAEINNFTYTADESGRFSDGESSIKLTQVPNYLAHKIRFEYDTPVNVINAQLIVYDRVNPDNAPVGVTCMVAEVIHPDEVQTDNGSGGGMWTEAAGSAGRLQMADNPGSGGEYAGDGSASTHLDTIHDWHFLMSVSPTSVGSKTEFGMLFSTEYL